MIKYLLNLFNIKYKKLDLLSNIMNRNTPDLLHNSNKKVFIEYLEQSNAFNHEKQRYSKSGRTYNIEQLYRILKRIRKGENKFFNFKIENCHNSDIINESNEKIKIKKIRFEKGFTNIELHIIIFDNTKFSFDIPIDALINCGSNFIKFLDPQNIEYNTTFIFYDKTELIHYD